ncbi:unnamed protein product [Linum tenue]|uniref:F-box protein At3g26010-like beta-propeller domain-containing protein n=1 Tax=Linum tenue TaxID=586396 RepID=A0AAV0QNL6_9ROSI|nr:unnamed protein product [Linum tenue]
MTNSGLANHHRLPPPTAINKLGDDLLVEILIRGLRNPRSACSSKLVCKRWSSLISSPRFNRRFVSHGRETNRPMPDDPLELLRILRGFLPPMPDGVRNALKDLVLCGFWDLGKDYEKSERSRSYLVCNPFTKQWIALPLAPPRKPSAGSYRDQAMLVCEPRISHKLDLGDDEGAVYFEYRFRVLHVFCSESGKWGKETLACCNRLVLGPLVSCNEELFWKYCELGFSVARFNPFRPDMPPASVDPPRAFLHVKTDWSVYVSQGALHIVAVENRTVPVRLSVWRLEGDGRSWREQFEGSLSETSKYRDYDIVGGFCPLGLHPQNPEIAFFHCTVGENKKNAVLCYDWRREELEVFCHALRVLQPRVCCWQAPIPRYKELQGVYDGSYSFWFQTQSKAKTPGPLPPSRTNW